MLSSRDHPDNWELQHALAELLFWPGSDENRTQTEKPTTPLSLIKPQAANSGHSLRKLNAIKIPIQRGWFCLLKCFFLSKKQIDGCGDFKGTGRPLSGGRNTYVITENGIKEKSESISGRNRCRS